MPRRLEYKDHVVVSDATFVADRDRWQPKITIWLVGDGASPRSLVDIPLVFRSRDDAEQFALEMARRLIDLHGAKLLARITDQQF